MSEWKRMSTLRLTAHLWRRFEGKSWETKCGLWRSDGDVQPYLEGDKVCAKCFPPSAESGGEQR